MTHRDGLLEAPRVRLKGALRIRLSADKVYPPGCAHLARCGCGYGCGSVRRALFPLYRPVKVVPAQPGRSRSTALAQPVTTDGASRGRSGKRPRKVEIINQPKNTFMTYIQQFEAELLKKLNGTEEEAKIVRWVSEKVLESYRNGITAGQKGVQVIRKGQSRRRGFPPVQ